MAYLDGNAEEAGQPPKTSARAKQSAAESQRDFELRFFESILERCPEQVDVLRVHADNLTARGLYARGLEVDRRLVNLRPRDPSVHYNLACSYALMHHTEEAIAALESALELGYHDFEHMLSDPDLEHIREDGRFLGMLGRHLKRLKKASRRV